jgi:hypothetical protein
MHLERANAALLIVGDTLAGPACVDASPVVSRMPIRALPGCGIRTPIRALPGGCTLNVVSSLVRLRGVAWSTWRGREKATLYTG